MRTFTLLALAAVLLGPQACNWPDRNPRADEAISRETFIRAYLELRRAGLRSPQAEITLSARDSVLSDLGLTEEDLLTFVEVWGEDKDVMQALWAELDSLAREERLAGRGENLGGDEDPSDRAEDADRGLRGRGG